MADVNPKDFPLASSLTGDELIPVHQPDGWKRTTVKLLPVSALSISYAPATGVTATTAQAAIDELAGEIMTPTKYTTNFDQHDATTAYVGEALPGTLTGAASWRIKKMDTSSGDLVMTWADGNALFDNIWDARSNYTYI